MSDPTFSDLITDPETAEDQIRAQREAAFQHGDHATWNGKKLKPFTISRETLFYSLRVSAGHPPLAQVVRRMEAFAADALILLYLCSHDPDHWAALRSEPASMIADIDSWADSNIEPDQLNDARLLALQILNRSSINRAEAAPIPAPRGSGASAYDPGNSQSQ